MNAPPHALGFSAIRRGGFHVTDRLGSSEVGAHQS